MPRRLATLAVALTFGAVAGVARAEPEEIPGPPVPVVTLDVLPLAIPTAELSPVARARAESVLARSVLAQRVSSIRFKSREAVYRFLVDHPAFAASVARALRVGEYRLAPREDGYWGDDARGATGMIRVLYADDSRRLYHLEGRYERPLLPTIEGQILVLLEFHHEPDEREGTVVEQSLTGHVRIDTPIVGALAPIVAALSRPLVEAAVERKVRRFFATVARVSRWAADEPEQVAAALDGHPDVAPGPSLTAFRAILLEGRPPAWARAPFHLARESLRVSGTASE
jgi:hypothetical protein